MHDSNVNIECAQGGLDAIGDVVSRVKDGEPVVEAYLHMLQNYSEEFSKVSTAYGITKYELIYEPLSVVNTLNNALDREKKQKNQNLVMLAGGVILLCGCSFYLYKNKSNKENTENNLIE